MSLVLGYASSFFVLLLSSYDTWHTRKSESLLYHSVFANHEGGPIFCLSRFDVVFLLFLSLYLFFRSISAVGGRYPRCHCQE